MQQEKRASRTHAIEQVIAALEDSRYEWRTITGVAKQTGLPVAQVRKIITKQLQDVVRAAATDESGRNLYTTRRHYRSTQGLGMRLLSALADRVA